MNKQEKFFFSGFFAGFRGFGFVVFMVLLLNGCSYPISENLRREAKPAVSFSELFQHPDAFIGRTVIYGGTIVKVTNLSDKAEIEVVQKELDSFGFPRGRDASGGRLVFVKSGYVESEIYARGREVIGAGKVIGSKVGKVENRDYRYPVIELEELHLWEKTERFYPAYPYWGYPFSPWNDPFYW